MQSHAVCLDGSASGNVCEDMTSYLAPQNIVSFRVRGRKIICPFEVLFSLTNTPGAASCCGTGIDPEAE
jgi:hypothetical protein